MASSSSSPSSDSISQYIASIDGNKIVIYLGVIVATLFAFANVLDPLTANVCIGVIVGILVVYYMNDKDITSTETMDADLYYKLKTLGSVDSPPWSKSWPLGMSTTLPRIQFSSEYLYLDADLINLIDSIKNDIGSTNLDNYLNMLRCVENVMHLKSDFLSVDMLDNAYESYQIAEDQAKAALNYGNAFKIGFLDASPVLRIKLKKFMTRFQLLLQRNLDFMKQKAERIPLNYKTHFITDFNGPVAYNKAMGMTGETDLAANHFNVY